MASGEGDGPRFERIVPRGDERARRVCSTCGFVHYENPKVVVGSVVRHGTHILLCRRAIPPRRGYWTLPAGYLELGETLEQGAAREAYEEAHARIRVVDLLALYSLPHISQVQAIFRAELLDEAISPGVESAEVALVPWSEVPWDELAFPSVGWALRQFDRARGRSGFAPYSVPPGADPHRLPDDR